MNITAKMIKELRDQSGAGMMDCKKALTATDGDMAKAFDWLRENSKVKGGNRENKIAAEGLSAYYIAGNTAAIVEVNSESDFVANTQEFKDLVDGIVKVIAENKPVSQEEANALMCNGQSVSEMISEKAGKFGEKLSFRRFEVIEKEDADVFGAYSHSGKITALVVISNCTEDKARDVAMQVVSMNPAYKDKDAVDEDVVEHEKSVQISIMKDDPKMANKPQNILEKIVTGKLGKFYKENCLTEMSYIKDDNMTVQQYLGNGFVKAMVRYETGEGMAKKEENFAEEVAAQMK